MSEEDLHAPQADHAKEVLNLVLPADYQPPKVMEPSEESFYSPASAIATQRMPVLSWRSSLSSMWRGEDPAHLQF
jgi:hypothetical protein